jgi:tRNA(adenine34) deaminase
MGPLDREMMKAALEEARRAALSGDVPVGAVVTRGDRLIGRAGNQREERGDPTAHAEMLALSAAAGHTEGWRLDGCTMYVTLEPCAMCAGAIVLARIDRLVVGAMDPKAGFAGSLGDLVRDPRLNHAVEVQTGVLADECGQLLRDFFRERRN